jgi:hypothetical protein
MKTTKNTMKLPKTLLGATNTELSKLTGRYIFGSNIVITVAVVIDHAQPAPGLRFRVYLPPTPGYSGKDGIDSVFFSRDCDPEDLIETVKAQLQLYKKYIKVELQKSLDKLHVLTAVIG